VDKWIKLGITMGNKEYILVTYEKLYYQGKLGKIGISRYNEVLKDYKEKGYKVSENRDYLKYEDKS
tara:strand:+ start:1225 stop:1422 length:198 start_codon:yes stop_codon:yes gene_type:complete